MRILFLEAVHNFGGARKSTLELASALQNKGHEVLLVDFWGCCLPFIKDASKRQLSLKIIAPRKKPFIVGHPSKIVHLGNAFQYFFLQLIYKKRFAAITQYFKPDSVCVNSLKTLAILQKNKHYNIDFYARGWFKASSISSFYKQKLQHYHPRYITVSNPTKKALVENGLASSSAITVCSPVVKKEALYKSLKKANIPFSTLNPLKILHAAGFYPSKGQHLSLAIAKILKAKKIPFSLTLAGIVYADSVSNHYLTQIQQKIVDDNLEKEVTMVLNQPKIEPYMAQTDILIHPSATEGFGRVILEAMACGKPVIANPVGGVTDLITHNHTGFLPAIDAINEYVLYIEKYVQQPQLLLQHGQAGLEKIKRNYTEVQQQKILATLYPL